MKENITIENKSSNILSSQELLTLFADQKLGECILKTLDEQRLPYTYFHLQQLKTLNISQQAIQSLAGIEHCRNLQFLAASQNQLTTLEPLQKLSQLEFLSVWGNELVTVAELENCQNLKCLQVFDNPIGQVSTLPTPLEAGRIQITSDKPIDTQHKAVFNTLFSPKRDFPTLNLNGLTKTASQSIIAIDESAVPQKVPTTERVQACKQPNITDIDDFSIDNDSF